jgi:eukaryotic-like serine/threonine-protein kinase
MATHSNDGFTGTERFELVRELGAGAMGVVYEVIDRQLNNTIALKTLKSADGRKLFRFKQEFRSLTELNHPNLIQLHELFADGDLWYFTMDFVKGVTFTEYVFQDVTSEDDIPTDLADVYPTLDSDITSDDELDAKPANRLNHGRRYVDLDRLRESLRQLTIGLIELHSEGMLHRDIKPANVMVAEDGRTVLLDFGLVAEMNATQSIDDIGEIGDVEQAANANIYETVEQGLAGTAGYMAPEQAQGKSLSTASDWYAVGVMLYQALTDRLPFRGRLID